MYLSQDVEKIKNIVYVQISDDEKELIKRVLRQIFTKNLILPYQLVAIQEKLLLFNKSIYIVYSVRELIKTKIFYFHFNYMKGKYILRWKVHSH